MSDEYEELERESKAAKKKPVRDMTSDWERYKPLPEKSDDAPEEVLQLCVEKGISYDTLRSVMEARYKYQGDGPTCYLGFPLRNRRGVVVGVKRRNLATGERDAEAGSRVIMPTVIGPRHAQDWLIVEGETDGARVYDLTKGQAAVLILPSGANAVTRDYLAPVPVGSNVFACTDADKYGDKAATKIRSILPNAVRVRPPVIPPDTDWCDWQGDSDAFWEIVRNTREYEEAGGHPITLAELAAIPEPEEGGIWDPFELVELGPGQLCALGGYSGDGKTAYGLQWALDAARNKHRVLYFSLEMPMLGLRQRFMPLLEEGEELTELDVRFLFNPAINEFGRMIELVEPDIAFIDHVHRLSDDRGVFEKTIRGINNAALSFDVPVVMLAQLTEDRGGHGRTMFPKPTDARLRDTAVLSQECSWTMYVWRERNKNDETRSEAEIYTGNKSRYAAPGGTQRFVRLAADRPMFVERDDESVIASVHDDEAPEPTKQYRNWYESEEREYGW